MDGIRAVASPRGSLNAIADDGRDKTVAVGDSPTRVACRQKIPTSRVGQISDFEDVNWMTRGPLIRGKEGQEEVEAATEATRRAEPSGRVVDAQGVAGGRKGTERLETGVKGAGIWTPKPWIRGLSAAGTYLLAILRLSGSAPAARDSV